MKFTRKINLIKQISNVNCIFIKNKNFFRNLMTSFIETTQQATTDMQDMNRKIFSHLKTYTFFFFYEFSEKEKKNPTILQKINFSLNQQNNTNNESNLSNTHKSKQVQLNLYDLNNHTDILHAISDVRSYSFENKAKIIIKASEQKLVFLLEEFQKMKVDFSSIPIVIHSNQFQSDISEFLGWKNTLYDSLALQSLSFYQECSEQWIRSSTEKIDLWRAQVFVSRQKGRILKLINNKLCPLPEDQKQLKQYLISHFCIGYHASLLLNCNQKITTNKDSIGNNFISIVERIKKFCCIGDKSLKSTTGIVNISLVDEKGEELQILKQLRSGDSEEQSQADLKSAKYKQYKDVLSILFANINVYQKKYLEKSVEGKINDGKIELVTFDSQKSHRKVCSSTGQIKIKLETPSIDVQIGESFYRLEHPEEIRISFTKKIKVGIHNQIVKC